MAANRAPALSQTWIGGRLNCIRRLRFLLFRWLQAQRERRQKLLKAEPIPITITRLISVSNPPGTEIYGNNKKKTFISNTFLPFTYKDLHLKCQGRTVAYNCGRWVRNCLCRHTSISQERSGDSSHILCSWEGRKMQGRTAPEPQSKWHRIPRYPRPYEQWWI